MRSDGIIAVAMEYKKAVEELKTVQRNLGYYRSMHNKLVREFDKYRKMRDQSVFEFDILNEQLRGSRVVIPFDPSKRKR